MSLLLRLLSGAPAVSLEVSLYGRAWTTGPEEVEATPWIRRKPLSLTEPPAPVGTPLATSLLRRARTSGPPETETEPWIRPLHVGLLVDNSSAPYGFAQTMGVFEPVEFYWRKRPWLPATSSTEAPATFFRRAWTAGPEEQEIRGQSRKFAISILSNGPLSVPLYHKTWTVGPAEVETQPWQRHHLFQTEQVVGTAGTFFRKARTTGPAEQETPAWTRKFDVGTLVYSPVISTRRRFAAVI